MEINTVSSELYTAEGAESARQAAADLEKPDPTADEAIKVIAANTKDKKGPDDGSAKVQP